MQGDRQVEFAPQDFTAGNRASPCHVVLEQRTVDFEIVKIDVVLLRQCVLNIGKAGGVVLQQVLPHIVVGLLRCWHGCWLNLGEPPCQPIGVALESPIEIDLRRVRKDEHAVEEPVDPDAVGFGKQPARDVEHGDTAHAEKQGIVVFGIRRHKGAFTGVGCEVINPTGFALVPAMQAFIDCRVERFHLTREERQSVVGFTDALGDGLEEDLRGDCFVRRVVGLEVFVSDIACCHVGVGIEAHRMFLLKSEGLKACYKR